MVERDKILQQKKREESTVGSLDLAIVGGYKINQTSDNQSF